MILDTNESNIDLKIAKLMSEEKLEQNDIARFRTFWRRNRDKFNIYYEIKLKDEYREEYEMKLSKIWPDLQDGEFIGEHLDRIRKVAALKNTCDRQDSDIQDDVVEQDKEAKNDKI